MDGICQKCKKFGKIFKTGLCPSCHILERNQVKRRAGSYYGIDQSKPGWSEDLSWQELMDARRGSNLNVTNL